MYLFVIGKQSILYVPFLNMIRRLSLEKKHDVPSLVSSSEIYFQYLTIAEVKLNLISNVQLVFCGSYN